MTGPTQNIKNPSFVLTETPCKEGVLDSAKLPLHHNVRTEKRFPFDCTDPNSDTLGYLMMYLVDRDRLVKATTNNPNSSRSHMMIHIQITNASASAIGTGTESGTGTTTKEGKSAQPGKDATEGNVPIDLFIGDFGGVENQFMCNDAYTLSDFINIKRSDDGKEGELFYKSEPEQSGGGQLGGAGPEEDAPQIKAVITSTNVSDALAKIQLDIKDIDAWESTEPVDIIDSTTTQFSYHNLHTGSDYLRTYDTKSSVLSSVIRSMVPVGQALYGFDRNTITANADKTIRSAAQRFRTNEDQKVFFKKKVLHIPEKIEFNDFKQAVLKLSFGVMTNDETLKSYVPIQLDDDFYKILAPTGIKPVYEAAYKDTGLFERLGGSVAVAKASYPGDTSIDYKQMFEALYPGATTSGYKVIKGTNHFYKQYQPLCSEPSRYPLFDKVRKNRSGFCGGDEINTIDKYLFEALGGKSTPKGRVAPKKDALVQVENIRSLNMIRFTDFDMYKTQIRAMNSFEQFFETFVPEKKKPSDPEPEHRTRFYLPNAYFLPQDAIKLTDGIPEIPYIHQVPDMDKQYQDQLNADLVYSALNRYAQRYVDDSKIGLSDPNIQPIYALYVCIIVKIYMWMIRTQHRFEYGELICGRRATEGDYINKTLKELRENIDMIMTVKNENVLYYSPDFVVDCFDQYCPVRGRCFKPSTPEINADARIIEAKSEIILWMHNRVHTGSSFDYKKFYQNIIVCIFCTFNVTRSSNNPPAICYIDHHRLKYLVAKYDEVQVASDKEAHITNILEKIQAIYERLPKKPIERVSGDVPVIEYDYDERSKSGQDTMSTITDTVSDTFGSPGPLRPGPGPVTTPARLTSKVSRPVTPERRKALERANVARKKLNQTSKTNPFATKTGSNVRGGGDGFIRDANRALATLLHGQQLYPREIVYGGAKKSSEEYEEALYRSISHAIYELLDKLRAPDGLPKCIVSADLKECMPDLQKLIELIDIHNAATPIGTLEFVDSVSKLNRVQNICYDYRGPNLMDLVDVIKQNESKQSASTRR